MFLGNRVRPGDLAHAMGIEPLKLEMRDPDSSPSMDNNAGLTENDVGSIGNKVSGNWILGGYNMIQISMENPNLGIGIEKIREEIIGRIVLEDENKQGFKKQGLNKQGLIQQNSELGSDLVNSELGSDLVNPIILV